MSPLVAWKTCARLQAFAFCWILLLAMAGHTWGQTLPVSFVSRIDSPLPGIPAGCQMAVADFNSDGKLDVAMCGNANNIWVLLGNGNGTFQPGATYTVGTTYPASVMFGDFNGDGHPDILVVNNDSTVSVLLNNGDGTLRTQVVTSILTNASGVVAVGDFDGDGKADIAVPITVAQHGDSGLSILLGNGDGTFQAPINSIGYGPTPKSIQAADFNRDGKLDVIWGSDAGATVFLGNNDGTALALTNSGIGGLFNMVVADFNNDGIPDVATLASGDDPVYVFLGKGDGTFGTGAPILKYPENCISLLAADFDGNGNLDIACYGFGSTFIWAGNGDGTFQPPLSPRIFGYAIAAGDFNGDGRVDLFSTALRNPLTDIGFIPVAGVALGKGDGSFLLDTVVDASCDCHGGITDGNILALDLNGDGEPDLIDVETPNMALNSFRILFGMGDGIFPATGGYILKGESEGGQSNAAAGDFNHDGKPDLAVIDAGYVGVFLGNGDGTFQPEVQYGDGTAIYVAVGDFNGDGNLDIVTNDSLILGNGDGSFGFAKNYAGVGYIIVVADFNHDGKLDVAGSGAAALGNGDGTFGSPINYPPGGGGTIAVADFNHDGNLDIVGSIASNQLDVMLGNGDGTFGTPKSYTVGNTPTSVTVGDFNSDGKTDIAVFNSGWSDVSVLLGNGDGTFQLAIYFGVDGGYGSISIADLNGDGSPDIAAEGAYLLFNRPLGAAATLTPNTIAFGNQELGAGSTPQVITLFNNGQSSLAITNINFTGPQAGDFAETNTCGSSVAAGTNCTISVTFTPAATGTRSASLSITGNGAGSPQTATLSGTGVGLGFGTAPGGSSSATVTAGQTAHYKLTIGGAGFSGTATFSCTGAPVGATCTVPASVNVSATMAFMFAVAVTTTPRASAAIFPNLFMNTGWLWAVALLGIVILPSSSRRGRVNPRLARFLPIALLLFIASCGGSSASGGGGGSGGNGGGTPAGNYTITVQATSGSVDASQPLILTVQ